MADSTNVAADPESSKAFITITIEPGGQSGPEVRAEHGAAVSTIPLSMLVSDYVEARKWEITHLIKAVQ